MFEVTTTRENVTSPFPAAISLSSYNSDKVDSDPPNRREVAGVEWLADRLAVEARIYADHLGKAILWTKLWGQVRDFPADVKQIPQSSYIYLRSWNIEKNEVLLIIESGASRESEHVNRDVPEIAALTNDRNLIYDNGGSQIFAPSP